ncbi:MAG: uncharacterized protein JWP61_2515 [Friedmanniella sp.]|nr:uncharacterized protein [Friedmanniella sp.]
MSQTPDPDYRAPRDPSFEAGTPGYEAQTGYFAGETPPAVSPDVVYDRSYAAEPTTDFGSSTASGTSSAADTAKETANTAKDEAAQVKDTVAGAGQQVAGTAKEEARNVVAETRQQASSLLSQAGTEVSAQASTQQQRVATLVQGYAHELEAMVSGSSESGALTGLADQASRKVSEVGNWLEAHEPRELLDEVTRFARRRPVAFLVGAAITGAVAGRLTRGLAANAKDEHDQAKAVSTPAPAASYTPARSLVDEVPTSVPTTEYSTAYGEVPTTTYADTFPGTTR